MENGEFTPGDIVDIAPAVVDRAEAGYGSFLNIYVRSMKGQKAQLWIYQCDWDIIQNDVLKFSSTNFDKAHISHFFSGKTLIAVETNESNDGVSLTFSEGVKLNLHENRDLYGDDDLLIVFFDRGYTISYVGRSGFYKEVSKSTDDHLSKE